MLIRVALLSLCIAIYNGFVTGHIGRLSPILARRSRLASRSGWTAVNDVGRLTIASVAQLCFLIVLIGLTGINVVQSLRFDAIVIVLGIVLGISEMGLSSFAAHVLMRIGSSVMVETPKTVEDWLVLARGGWMRYFTNAIRIAPRWYLLSVTLLYITVEEVIFRVVVLSYLLPEGPELALAGSVAAFVIVQVIHTPNWRTALFPATGATIVGLVHGWLFLHTGDVTPLVAAHCAFFMAAVL
jgi:hypothetical protein